MIPSWARPVPLRVALGFAWFAALALAKAAPAAAAIFADGFETGDLRAWCSPATCPGPPACVPLVITAGSTTVPGWGSLPAHTFVWSDAACKRRTALMVDQRAGGAGYLRRYTYPVAGSDRVCTGVDSNGGAIQGMGYVENHLGSGDDNWTVSTPGTTTVRLAGRHHALVEYAMPNHQLPRPEGGTVTVPTTVQWFFAGGRSHPIFAVGQDASGYNGGNGNLGADSRSPYGTMSFAGDGNDPTGYGLAVAGVSWGDTFKFVSTVHGSTAESSSLLSSSGWRYDQPNTIPYALAWVSAVDAEQGTVATSPITYQDQGSDPRTYPQTGFGKNQQALNGPFPTGDDWAYQMMNYPDVPAGGTTDKKMAWGANFGFLGGFDNFGDPALALDTIRYSIHRDSTTPFTGSRVNGLTLAYSTFIVLGTHAGGYTGGTTGQVVRQMENVQHATLTATTGTVRTTGPRGVGSASGVTVSYSPPGYNHVYATWDLYAAGSSADFTLAAGAPTYPLENPIFVLQGYAALTPPAAVEINGASAAADVDYLATVDAPNGRLWLTVLRTVTTSLRVRVTP